jgi:hypothetical protein
MGYEAKQASLKLKIKSKTCFTDSSESVNVWLTMWQMKKKKKLIIRYWKMKKVYIVDETQVTRENIVVLGHFINLTFHQLGISSI